MSTKIRLFLFIWVIGFFALLPTSQAEVVDRIVAVVNNAPITLYELDKLMAANMDQIKKAMQVQGKESAENFQAVRAMALKKLIDDKLLEQEMDRLNITVTEEDIQKAVQSVLERTQMTRQQLVNKLKADGATYSAYLADLKKQLRRLKFMSQTISSRVKATDQDLEKFFSAHPEQFAAFQSIKMAQIIIPIASSATEEEVREAEKKSVEVLKKAKRGAKFEKLGTEYSTYAAAAVPALYQVSQLAPQIVSVLASLEPGKVSEPIRSSMGIHIIKLIERQTLMGEENRALREQVREKVFELKLEEELQGFIDKLKDKSYIEIRLNT